MHEAFKDMPTLLKFITVHALLCFALFVVVVVIPGIPITFNGEIIDSSELWVRGLGLPTVVIGLTMPIAGFLMLKRWQYSRQFYAFLLVSFMVGPYVVWQQLVPMVFGVVLSCAIIGYLFINREVRVYFGS